MTTDQQTIKKIADETDNMISTALNFRVENLESMEARGLVLGFVTNLKAEIHKFEQAGKELV